MFKYFLITTAIALALYFIIEYRMYIKYFFDLLRNKYSYEKDLSRLMNKNKLKRNIEDKYIIKYLDLLKVQLIERGYNPPKDDFVVNEDLKRRLIYSRFDEKTVRELMKEILKYLSVPSDNISLEVKYKSSKIKTGIAGMYYYKLNKIVVFVDPNYSFETIVSIVAHECMHYFLESKDIAWENEIQNEVFTDLSVIYLGFGKYTLEGYKEKRRVIYESENQRFVDSDKIGYIGYKDVEFALKYIKKIKNK